MTNKLNEEENLALKDNSLKIESKEQVQLKKPKLSLTKKVEIKPKTAHNKKQTVDSKTNPEENESQKKIVTALESSPVDMALGEGETIVYNEIKLYHPEQLLEMGLKYKIDNIADMNKQSMVYAILTKFSELNINNVIIGEGVLEVLPDGYGFLRSQFSNYVAGPDDIYVGPNHIKRFGLRTGDIIKGPARAPKKGEKYLALIRVNELNFKNPEVVRNRVKFEDLTPLYPQDKLNIEGEGSDDTCRIIDLISPIGKGQRSLIVAPPRSGKTELMKNVAHAISRSHPEIYLIVLLIDERPEEVTDMQRSIKGEVVSSTFDEPAIRHVQLAEIVIEKAKRLVENKHDVVILLDNITRLARAYNNVVPSSGKILTGGVDGNALQRPKRFLGAARNIENGGSLTIISTALIDTGSKMDEVIFEEFKGTGNSEIILDRKLSDKRIYPAIDITKSGTRKEELLIGSNINKSWILRKLLTAMSPTEAMDFLKGKLRHTKTNEDFYNSMNS